VFNDAFKELGEIETKYEHTLKIVSDEITVSIKVNDEKLKEIKNVTDGVETEIVATIKAARGKVTNVVKMQDKKPAKLPASAPVQIMQQV
jgi:hypothetical protein